MQWAEGGSLDDFIDVRLGRASSSRVPELHPTSHAPEEAPQPGSGTAYSRGARIRAFRAMQRAPPEEREKLRREMSSQIGGGRPGTDWKAVHLLSAEEVKSLFQDVVEGLAFLVSQPGYASLILPLIICDRVDSMRSRFYISTSSRETFY